MPTPAISTHRVQFGVFELDLQRMELRKQGVKIKLQDQPLKLLQVLLETKTPHPAFASDHGRRLRVGKLTICFLLA